jgi:hypothetical protein
LRQQDLAWTIALLGILAGTALWLGAADWYATYPATGPDGGAVRLPNTFASGDHPWQIARAQAAADALRDGWLPRWYAFHQGGFPAEFYPSGGSGLVAVVALLGFGSIPLPVAHKLVTIAVLLLPPVAYWALARRERLPASVAVLATLLHLFIPGDWFGGGSRELIDHGLLPNVLAAYLVFFVLLWGADWLRSGSRCGLLLATGAATLAIYSNPRSILGLIGTVAAVAGIAVWEVVGTAPGGWRCRLHDRRGALAFVLGRAAAFAVIVALLASALLLPLRANQALYHFPQFVRFDGPWDVFRWYVGGLRCYPLLAPLVIGIVIAAMRRGFFGRSLALSLALTMLIIDGAGWYLRDTASFAQLEGPRLMPLLRPATMFLAALGAHELLRAALAWRLPRLAAPLAGVVPVALAALVLLSPLNPIPAEFRGLPRAETTDQPGFAAVAEAALRVDAASSPSDRLLLIGNPLARHSSFWLPALTGLPTFHGDWIWDWRTIDYGSYGQLADQRAALAPDFLSSQGLTMVLIGQGSAGNGLLAYADRLPHLRKLDPGTDGGYAVYRVAVPPGPANGWVAFSSGGVTSLELQTERLEVRGRASEPGVARFAINAYPGWVARVNGNPVSTASAADGYLLVPIPAGEVALSLEYAGTPGLQHARALVALGALLLAGLLLSPLVRAAHERWPAALATAKS